MITIFKVGDYDFSDYVNRKTYDVYREDETISWLDANATKHTTVVRRRVHGKIELVFFGEAEHSDFVKALDNNCANGYWLLSVYVNNIHELKNIRARINVSTKAIFGNNLIEGRPIVNKVVLDIEEV